MGLEITNAGFSTSPTFTGAVTTSGGIVGPSAAPVAGRGYIVQLSRTTGVNLNSVAATTLLTTAGSGFTRCVVTAIYLNNFSMAATTASVSFGLSGTPTDYAATQTFSGANTNRVCRVVENAGGVVLLGTSNNFVANVTIAQGVAATCDISVWGFYE